MKIIKKDYKNGRKKKQQYGCEQLKNLPDEKLFEYRKKYYKMRKTPYYIYK